MLIRTVEYVGLSDLTNSAQLVESFSESIDACFGTNAYSLVGQSTVLDFLENEDGPDAEAALEKLRALPEGIYIDLES